MSVILLLHAWRKLEAWMSVSSLPGYKPLDFGPIAVETIVSRDVLDMMLRRIETIFTTHARDRPHWTVLTSPQFEPDQFAANRDRFFQSGLQELQVFQAFIARAGLDLSNYRTCLELGCGVGRVTLALASVFERVIGIDIAAPMLDEAERTAATFAIRNIHFLLVNKFSAYEVLPKFDVLFSGIVLQHNPPPIMGYILGQLLGKLRSGGIAFFQLPTYRHDYAFSAAQYLDTPPNLDIEMHVFPQRALFALLAEYGCTVLEIREDGSVGESWSQVSNTLLVRKH